MNWFKPNTADDLPPLPPAPRIATLPEPRREPVPHDAERGIIEKAAVVYEQIKREREAAQVELAETMLKLQGARQKIDFLEKENAQLRLEIVQKTNDMQTLQSQVEEYRRFMDVWKDMNDKTRQVFDRFGVKGSPKKERKPKPKKEKPQTHERQAPDQPAQADG